MERVEVVALEGRNFRLSEDEVLGHRHAVAIVRAAAHQRPRPPALAVVAARDDQLEPAPSALPQHPGRPHVVLALNEGDAFLVPGAERLRLAREFLGNQDPLEFFLAWKTPDERYQRKYKDPETDIDIIH